MLLIIIHNSCW